MAVEEVEDSAAGEGEEGVVERLEELLLRLDQRASDRGGLGRVGVVAEAEYFESVREGAGEAAAVLEGGVGGVLGVVGVVLVVDQERAVADVGGVSRGVGLGEEQVGEGGADEVSGQLTPSPKATRSFLG